MGSEQHASGGAAELEDRLTAQALADGDPAGWFERFYRAAAAGEVELPWNRAEPHRLLTRWAAERRLDGSGRRAIVVGCGQGTDAEYVARLGFQVVAFDIAETAIRLARQRYPGSAVRYQAADLLNPPGEWLHAFDLVVEIITVQALPDPPQRQAIANVGRLVRPGGTLLAVEAVRGEHECAPELGPWPLSRADIDAFGTDGLLPVGIELAVGPGGPADLHWLAEFRRPRGLPASTQPTETARRSQEETSMKHESATLGGPTAGAASAPGLPAAVDRAAFQAELDALRVREKAHTREGDAIAAARRRLPIVEVAPIPAPPP